MILGASTLRLVISMPLTNFKRTAANTAYHSALRSWITIMHLTHYKPKHYCHHCNNNEYNI